MIEEKENMIVKKQVKLTVAIKKELDTAFGETMYSDNILVCVVDNVCKDLRMAYIDEKKHPQQGQQTIPTDDKITEKQLGAIKGFVKWHPDLAQELESEPESLSKAEASSILNNWINRFPKK